MVNDFINNLANHECLRKLAISKELLKRFLSSFLFIPLIALVFFLNKIGFYILCGMIYLFISFELFSSKIPGHFFIRIVASFFCFIGIFSFAYVHNIYGKIGCIILICIASFTDMGSYFFGKWLRGPKLCPKISPNKTWAGFFGGFIFCNACFFIYKCFWSIISPFDNLLFLQLLILSSIGGDLLESSLKRHLGIKDLGKMFPGHGGISDRLDSLILVSIIFSIYLYTGRA